MTYLDIALRNLTRQKKRTLLLGSAIAFGVLMITLVNGFTAGAMKNVKENFSYLLAGHIYIEQETKRDDGEVINNFTDGEVVLSALDELGVDPSTVVRRSAMSAVLLFNGRQTTQNIQGVDWTSEQELTGRLELAQGELSDVMADPRSVIIGQGAADKLGVIIGDEITIRTSTVTGQANVGSFVVRGILTDPSFLGSISSYAHLERVNQMINLAGDSYQSINITLESLEQVDSVTADIRRLLSQRAQLAPIEETRNFDLSDISMVFEGDEEEFWEGSRFVVENINQFFSVLTPIYTAVNGFGYGLLALIFLIIMVGITNTFRMIMFERIKEIGTMRAVGVQKGGIRSIFLWEAASLGSLGYLLGGMFALVVTWFVAFFRVPPDNAFNLFTFNGRVTFPVPLAALISNYLLVVVLTLMAALFPANKAAKAQPADALRQ